MDFQDIYLLFSEQYSDFTYIALVVETKLEVDRPFIVYSTLTVVVFFVRL